MQRRTINPRRCKENEPWCMSEWEFARKVGLQPWRKIIGGRSPLFVEDLQPTSPMLPRCAAALQDPTAILSGSTELFGPHCCGQDVFYCGAEFLEQTRCLGVEGQTGPWQRTRCVCAELSPLSGRGVSCPCVSRLISSFARSDACWWCFCTSPQHHLLASGLICIGKVHCLCIRMQRRYGTGLCAKKWPRTKSHTAPRWQLTDVIMFRLGTSLTCRCVPLLLCA